MKRFIEEYGRLAISIIAMLGFFFLLGMLLGREDEDGSIKHIFRSNRQDSTALFGKQDAIKGVDGEFNYDPSISDFDYSEVVIGDTLMSDSAPYFKVDENAIFTIGYNQFDYTDAFRYITPYYNGENILNKSKSSDGKDIKITVLAYEYKPVIEKSESDINGHVVMEEVYAKDKYGHYIYSLDGKEKLKTLQPKYDISNSVELTKSNYISSLDKNYKIKLVYRVQVGTYKAECEAVYTKNKVTNNKSVSGKSVIKFVYE